MGFVNEMMPYPGRAPEKREVKRNDHPAYDMYHRQRVAFYQHAHATVVQIKNTDRDITYVLSSPAQRLFSSSRNSSLFIGVSLSLGADQIVEYLCLAGLAAF